MQHNSTKICRVLRKGIKLLLFLMLALVLLFEVYAVIVVSTEANVPLPPAFGNFERVRALLMDDEQQEEFSFAVVGDTQGTETFEQIAGALQDEPLSFMVLLGDCVRKGTVGYHRFFRCEWAGEISLPFPVFYVVGNHDVDREKFPVSQFEQLYGPTNFSFAYHGCLFVVLRVLPKPYSIKESLAFLESLLSSCRHNYDKVFVFMHIPPPVSSDFSARSFDNAEELVALFNRFYVDYVITGDYHGYARVKIKNTTYIVTGGGGGHLEEQKFGKFHHAIVIKVGPHSVSERVLLVSSTVGFEDKVEQFALAEIYPWMESNWAIAVILNAGIVGILFWAFRGCLRNRRAF